MIQNAATSAVSAMARELKDSARNGSSEAQILLSILQPAECRVNMVDETPLDRSCFTGAVVLCRRSKHDPREDFGGAMSNSLNRDSREHFVARINSFNMQSRRQWGTMDPVVMLAHLRRSLEISLNRISIKDDSTILSRTLISFAALYLMPIPKARIKAPDAFFYSEVGSIEIERAKLIAVLDEFLAVADRNPARRTVHPFFGSLSLNQWRRLHGKHFDHHLRQFGV